MPYSRESVITETPTVTTAKLIYFARTSVDASLEEARRLLIEKRAGLKRKASGS